MNQIQQGCAAQNADALRERTSASQGHWRPPVWSQPDVRSSFASFRHPLDNGHERIRGDRSFDQNNGGNGSTPSITEMSEQKSPAAHLPLEGTTILQPAMKRVVR
jgi:hypothetical protein